MLDAVWPGLRRLASHVPPRLATHAPRLWIRGQSGRYRCHHLHRSFSSATPGLGSSNQNRFNSSLAVAEVEEEEDSSDEDGCLERDVASWEDTSSVRLTEAQRFEVHRLERLRNVGILAHVDAGKTTVTERMLALAGVVRQCGSVDDGNTVTDYLPAERERGITIQSAAIQFDWAWHNNKMAAVRSEMSPDDSRATDKVRVQLIDTPGHVDFSVEVNRSIAVLDGAVLVVDSVAGAQAQTETVWRALTRPSHNNHDSVGVPFPDDVAAYSDNSSSFQHRVPPLSAPRQSHAFEPLPCLAMINKMDKDGCCFGNAVKSIRQKLPGANPIPIQMPLFRMTGAINDTLTIVGPGIVAVHPQETTPCTGTFAGVVDLIHMRAIIWPDPSSGSQASNVEECVPHVIPLWRNDTHEPIDENCSVTQEAISARFGLVESLAEVDSETEEYYLNECDPSAAALRAAVRRVVLSHKALPVLAGAALKGKGVEPLLDAIADFLPSPLDRLPPAVTKLDEQVNEKSHASDTDLPQNMLGHPMNKSLLALAFKVIHMKGRGGSGDGRVVFARVYSGMLHDRQTIQVITPPALGETPEKPRIERIGGMLELAGGRFNNMEGGVCQSGDVCALIGLKSVVTGDTLMIAPTKNVSKNLKKEKSVETLSPVCLAGVASPKPVLKVRLEAETTDQQTRLSEVLALLSTEDPSLVVEETEASTMLSGLGELHIEVTLDRLRREFGIDVMVGPPSVAYRETLTSTIQTSGMLDYDRMIGGTRLQAAVNLRLEPRLCSESLRQQQMGSTCMLISDPVVTIGSKVRDYLGFHPELSEDDLMIKSPVAKALIQGCQGALKRGPLQSAAMANVLCHIIDIEAEGGSSALKAMPGAARASVAHAISTIMSECSRSSCTVLEPTMSVEIIVPNEDVGTIVSDLSGRRGSIGDVVVGEGCSKSLVRGDVPLVEILGYASSLRSLTGGEGSFTAEYKGHSPC